VKPACFGIHECYTENKRAAPIVARLNQMSAQTLSACRPNTLPVTPVLTTDFSLPQKRQQPEAPLPQAPATAPEEVINRGSLFPNKTQARDN